MNKWPETATAVGARLDEAGSLQIVCPYGLDDLFGLTVRRSPLFADAEAFRRRIETKKWLDKWPLLKVIWDEPSANVKQ